MHTHMIYPWQQKQWRYLLQCRKQSNLAHALLFYGAEGLGKLDFAKAFAALLLCENEDAKQAACETCSACVMLQAGTHPDLFLLQPDQANKTIKIDQIRALCSDLNQTAQRGSYKIAIISPADAMNQAAANALLKTLEEPEGLALLILISALPHSLPATIRSRCQKVNFASPDLASTRNWLISQFKLNRQNELIDLDALTTFADSSPLKALHSGKADLDLCKKLQQDLLKLRRHERDAVSLAAEYERLDAKIFCAHLMNNFMHMIKQRFKVDGKTVERQIDESMNLTRMFAYYDKLLRTNKALQDGISLNKQLLLEDLLLDFAKL